MDELNTKPAVDSTPPSGLTNTVIPKNSVGGSKKQKINLILIIPVALIVLIVVLFLGFTLLNGGANNLISPGSNFSCTGEVPNNATICGGANSSLTQDYPITLAQTCTENPICQYSCDAGFVFDGTGCVLSQITSFACVGNPIENATLCPSSNTDLTSDVNIVLSGSCTPQKKCEYVCNPGYIGGNLTCAKKYCESTNKLDLSGGLIAIASAGKDANSGISPLGAKAPYLLIFDTNAITLSFQNPYIFPDSDQNVVDWLVAKKVKTFVVGDSTYLLEYGLNGTGITCLKMNGRISDIIKLDVNSATSGPYGYIMKYCPDVNSVELSGTKLAIATVNTDLNSPISAASIYTNYFLLFENGKFLESIKNDLNKTSLTYNKDVVNLLLSKDVNRVVFGYRTVPLSLELTKVNMGCFATTGTVNKIVK